MAFTAQQSFTLNSGTSPALSATTPATVTFGYNGNNTAIRYAYVVIDNASGFTVFVRTDGNAATNAGGDFNYEVANGTYLVVSNQLAWWSQAATVIPAAAGGASSYSVASGSGPLEVNPMGTSPYGQSANPGTSVSIVAISGATVTATTDVTITGTG